MTHAQIAAHEITEWIDCLQNKLFGIFFLFFILVPKTDIVVLRVWCELITATVKWILHAIERLTTEYKFI